MEVDGAFLEELAEAARAGAARLEPQVVLAGSNRLARDLGRRVEERTGGWANLRFLTFLDLARTLAGCHPEAAGRRLLGRAGKLALVREALRRASSRGPLPPAASRPGFTAALAGLFDDLMDAGFPDLPPLTAGTGEREIDLAALYRDWRALLRANTLHPARLITLAAAHAAGFPRQLGTGRLWMAGFYELTATQLALLQALRRAGVEIAASLPYPLGPGSFAAPIHDDLLAMGARVTGPRLDRAAGNLGRLQNLLFSGGAVPERPPGAGRDGSLLLLSCPDEEREVREAARAAVRLFREDRVPFHRMAVAYPQGRREVYAPLVDEVFASAGIPCEPSGLREAWRSPGGRALRALLELLGEREPGRSQLLDLLSYKGCSLPLSPGRLERLSRRGGIAAWSGDWEARLRAAARPFTREEDGEKPAPDPSVEKLVPRLRDVLRALAEFPGRGPWPALLEALDDVAARAAPAAGGLLAELRPRLELLGNLEPEADLDSFRAAVLEELATLPVEEEPLRGPVVSGSFPELRGLHFEVLFLLGAAERSFPEPARPDPFLSDSLRAKLNALPDSPGMLPLKGRRFAEEELVFAGLAASAARVLQISYPRIDPGRGRARLPSVFFLKAAGALLGRRVKLEDIQAAPEVGRVGLNHGDHDLESSLTPSELLLGAAIRVAGGEWPRGETRKTLASLSPGIGRLARLEEMKWEERLTAADGLVSAELVLRRPDGRIVAAGGSISPTRLECFATCPHRYFLSHVLGLRQLEEPEEALRIEPMDRGRLVHLVLQRTYQALKDQGLLPLNAKRLARAREELQRIAAEEFTRAEKEGVVGLPVLWEIDRERIAEGLESLLERDAAERVGLTPERFEIEFGQGPAQAQVTLSLLEGEAAVPLRGKIDRLDVDPASGAFRVIDYKTGKLPELPFKGGQALQLPLYLLAAAEILRRAGHTVDLEASRALYRGMEADSKDFLGAGWADTLAKLRLAAGTVARSIESGLFFPLPGRDRKNCEWCDFKSVCDPRVEAIAERKRGDGRAAEFFSMKEALSDQEAER